MSMMNKTIKWQQKIKPESISDWNIYSCNIIAWLLVISLDRSQCRNSKMNLTSLPIPSLSHWESLLD